MKPFSIFFVCGLICVVVFVLILLSGCLDTKADNVFVVKKYTDVNGESVFVDDLNVVGDLNFVSAKGEHLFLDGLSPVNPDIVFSILDKFGKNGIYMSDDSNIFIENNFRSDGGIIHATKEGSSTNLIAFYYRTSPENQGYIFSDANIVIAPKKYIKSGGTLHVEGDVNANSYYGDGSHLTGISADVNGHDVNFNKVWIGNTSNTFTNVLQLDYNTSLAIDGTPITGAYMRVGRTATDAASVGAVMSAWLTNHTKSLFAYGINNYVYSADNSGVFNITPVGLTSKASATSTASLGENKNYAPVGISAIAGDNTTCPVLSSTGSHELKAATTQVQFCSGSTITDDLFGFNLVVQTPVAAQRFDRVYGLYVQPSGANGATKTSDYWSIYSTDGNAYLWGGRYYFDDSYSGETIDDANFTMPVGSVFVGGQLGSEGSFFTDGNAYIKGRVYAQGGADVAETFLTRAMADAITIKTITESIEVEDINPDYNVDKMIAWENCRVSNNSVEWKVENCVEYDEPITIRHLEEQSYDITELSSRYVRELEPGDVVCGDANYIKKCDVAYSPSVYGVVSDTYSVLGEYHKGGYPVGLVGVVKIKVVAPVAVDDVLISTDDGRAQAIDWDLIALRLGDNPKAAAVMISAPFAIAQEACASGECLIWAKLK